MTTTDRTGADTAPAPDLSVAERARLDKIEGTPACDEDTVERVARAMYDEAGNGAPDWRLPWDELPEHRVDIFRRLARAAIDALKPAPGTDSSGQLVVDVLRGGEHVATLGVVSGSVSVDSSGQADEELTETVLAVFADWDARDARQREEGSGQAVQRPSATRRYVVGTYCPRGNGHFDLIASERYDGSCGSKGWPLIIEVEDGDDTSQLPKGYFEVDD